MPNYDAYVCYLEQNLYLLQKLDEIGMKAFCSSVLREMAPEIRSVHGGTAACCAIIADSGERCFILLKIGGSSRFNFN
jgi:hypothetical protein